MTAVRVGAALIDLVVTVPVIVVGFMVVVAGGDGPWWLLPFGLIYLFTFGWAGRQLWRWFNTPKN